MSIQGKPRPDASAVCISLPHWVDEVVDSFGGSFQSEKRRMDLVVTLSRQNVKRNGAPFAAAVFSGSTLVAAGVNRVHDTGMSIAHAEIVALSRAQMVIGRARVDASGPYELVTSAEPCCQCLGAVFFSGMERLVCGATRDDSELFGFDEGPRSRQWISLLVARGISVARRVCQAEARAVLGEFVARGGRPDDLRHPTISTGRRR
jgi:tRNA(Arg) A34 adenosine deaminase TadA